MAHTVRHSAAHSGELKTRHPRPRPRRQGTRVGIIRAAVREG